MNYIGIDLSKAYFDATVLSSSGEESHEQFENTATGFRAFQRWLKQQQIREAHICMEATNIYWEALAEFLYAQGYTVSVVNPARIKGFAMSQLQRNKTDKLDSKVIAYFCRALKPRTWQPPSASQRKLRNLVRHREALVKTRTQQKNRLANCRDEDVQTSLMSLIATLDAEIERIDAQITAYINQDPDLREQKRLLSSIKGLGNTTVHILLAELYDLADYESAHAAAADAGLTPAHYESGDTVRRKSRMSKVGKAAVRGALYWPAITAIRTNPIVQALAQRLEAQKKHNKVIIGAAMRKLIHLAYGVLKNRTPFDPNFNSPAQSVST